MTNKHSLICQDNIRKFLDECPDIIEMTKISPVIVEQREATVMGFVLIAESHISVHASLNTGIFFIDIFSCTFFNVYAVTALIKSTFEPCDVMNVKTLDRGSEFLKT